MTAPVDDGAAVGVAREVARLRDSLAALVDHPSGRLLWRIQRRSEPTWQRPLQLAQRWLADTPEHEAAITELARTIPMILDALLAQDREVAENALVSALDAFAAFDLPTADVLRGYSPVHWTITEGGSAPWPIWAMQNPF